jgi:hypothetical protein
MSVELTRTGWSAKMYLDDPCTCCGEKLWPPFMVWRGKIDILICSDCAEHIRDGFMADLVHLTAAKQFQKLQPRAAFTLLRTSVQSLEAADRAWDEAHYGKSLPPNITKIK